MAHKAFFGATATVVLLLGCGKAAQDLSYTNPEWRSSVKASVSFPLAEQVTLRVGLGAGTATPSPDGAALAWLQEKTNIKLEFVGLAGGRSGLGAGEMGGLELGQVADVELGEMIRSGKLPDILPEGRFDLGDESLRSLFVDMLEFTGLTPSFRQVVASAPRFRDGLLARLSAGDALYSMGSYDPDHIPFAGVLAYRQDLFDARGLATDSWQSIRHSLQELKSAYPESAPFGGTFDTIMTMMPSWFGSGYDTSNIVYYDNDSAQWRFGPYEDQFREMVRFLADLYRQGLLSSEFALTRQDDTTREFSSNRAFMAPYAGLTGASFSFAGDYGKVTPEGKWNGEGAWVSALPLPPPPSGGTAKMSARRFSSAGDGWLVYNQSKHVGEAIALLDLLFTEEASRVLALGPEGTAWKKSGAGIELQAPYGDAYREGGTRLLAEKMRAAGVATDVPLKGLGFGFTGAFGYPQAAPFRYYLLRDVATNRLGVDLYAETGLRIPRYDSEFDTKRTGLVLSLETQIESAVASFIIGRRDLSEYEAFKAELGKTGADELLSLYRERCTPGDPKVLAGK